MRRDSSGVSRCRRVGCFRRAAFVLAGMSGALMGGGCSHERADISAATAPTPVADFHVIETELRSIAPGHRIEGSTEWADSRAFFDNPRRVLEAVLSRAAPRALVRPTERYYYFRFTIPGRRVAGNLRFTDAEEGVLHVGYYDLDDPGRFRAASFTESDGVVVRWDETRGVVRIRCGAIRVDFTLDRANLHPTPDARPRGRERVISGILDESGYALWLMYDDESAQFFYVLRGDRPLPETLDRVRTPAAELAIGRSSRFVFARDATANRWILVGVHAEQVRRNSFFDGPFDQVPPRLAIRAELERSYPYVTMRGGIDDHGNFRRLPGQRVAISPYRQYESLEEIVSSAEQARARGAEPWRVLVRESKRDFHLRFADDATPTHRRERSVAWPANHRAAASRLWPEDHAQGASMHWPAGHEVGPSLLQSPP